MAMTMRESQEIILRNLATMNTLPIRRFPYLADPPLKGNYAFAEQVKRTSSGDVFTWEAHSVYAVGEYEPADVVRESVERAFSGPFYKDVEATLITNESWFVRIVNYRFKTHGIDRPRRHPDFCPSCGWNTQHNKCVAPPEHNECNFPCSRCGAVTGVVGSCVREIHMSLNVSMPIVLDHNREPLETLPERVKIAVGEVILDFALAENNLRELLKELPGYCAKSYIADDIRRLKDVREALVAQAKSISNELGDATLEGVQRLVRAYGEAARYRNALSHGQAVAMTTNLDSEDSQTHLEIIHKETKILLTASGMEKPVEAVKELQLSLVSLMRVAEFIKPNMGG